MDFLCSNCHKELHDNMWDISEIMNEKGGSKA